MKNQIAKIIILLMTLSLILSLTACDGKAIANLEKEAVAESEMTETSEVEAEAEAEAELEAETEIKETEGKKSIAEINAELAKKQKSQDGKNKSKLSQSIKENTEEFRAFRERMRRDYKGKSLGKLYPKHTLTWNGITLEYLPFPDDLIPDADTIINDPGWRERRTQEYADMGYILEAVGPFRRNDGQSTHWGAHNRTPGFKPFIGISLGNDIYVTGYKGTTFHYKVVDIIDWFHGGEYQYNEESFYESLTGNLAKIKGTDELDYIDEYNPMQIEAITLTWCKDFVTKRYIFAVPIEHYELYVEEGLIDPID